MGNVEAGLGRGERGSDGHGGVSRRARRLFVHSTLRAAVFVHPTDATGTKVGFEGELTSIEASFDFHLLKTRELSRPPHVSPFWAPPHLEGGGSVAS